MNLEEKKYRRPIGLFIFGWLLIMSSIVQMYAYTFGYGWYKEIFNYLPLWLINVRYWFFWLQQIPGISVGIGLLNGNNFCRKIAIAIAVFSIMAIYWKYPYRAFLNRCQFLDYHYGGMFAARHLWELSFVRMCKIYLIFQYVIDVTFFGSLLYYLNRPLIKEYFVKRSQNRL